MTPLRLNSHDSVLAGDEPSVPLARPREGLPGALAALALAYLVAALLSLVVSRQPGSIATLWYANAVAIAVFHARPVAQWPALAAVVALVNPLANWLWGDPPGNALAFLPANLGEIVLAAWLLRRFGPSCGEPLGAAALLRLLLLGGVLPQAVGATLGALTLGGHDLTAAADTAIAWFSGSVIGAVSVLPLAVLCTGRPWSALRPDLLPRALLALVPGAFGVTLAAVAVLPYPFVYVLLPLLLAAVIVPQAAVGLLTTLTSLTIAGALGLGVFVPPPLSAQWEMLYVHLAFAVTLLPAQMLAAAIGELRRSRARLAERTLALRRANDSLEQFVRIASHDLREPLNTVASFGGLLVQSAGPALDPRSRQYLEIMLKGSERMRTLLDDVLQFVSVQQGASPAFEPVALREVLGDVTQSLAARIAATQAEIIVDIAPGAERVRGHPVLLSLVLQNLLQNAMKFMPEGRTPRIRVSARLDGAQVQVEVADNGIGIAAADQARLFQPFQRLHPRRIYEGTGLGLALARQIVSMHGGVISVDSVPGEGTRMTLTLPPTGPGG